MTKRLCGIFNASAFINNDFIGACFINTAFINANFINDGLTDELYIYGKTLVDSIYLINSG